MDRQVRRYSETLPAALAPDLAEALTALACAAEAYRHWLSSNPRRLADAREALELIVETSNRVSRTAGALLDQTEGPAPQED